MQPSALHGALRLSTAAHPPCHTAGGRCTGATAAVPDAPPAGHASEHRGAPRGRGAASWLSALLCFVHQAARGRTTQPSVPTTAPPPLGVAPARASASHRQRCAAPCVCCVLCAGRGMCWRHADETEAPVFVTTTKETPLLQHPAHSAAASWGVTRLTAPCPAQARRDPRPATRRPVCQRATPHGAAHNFLRPRAPWRACREMPTPRRPGPRRRRRATTSSRTCSPAPPGLGRCHARAAGQRHEPGLPCRPHTPECQLRAA